MTMTWSPTMTESVLAMRAAPARGMRRASEAPDRPPAPTRDACPDGLPAEGLDRDLVHGIDDVALLHDLAIRRDDDAGADLVESDEAG